MSGSNISLQLYTLRHEIEKDFAGSIARAAKIGFSQVEPWNFVARVAEYAKVFSDNGITAQSAHAHLVGVARKETFEAASKLGIKTIIEPMVDESGWLSIEKIAHSAEEMNKAADEAVEYGLQVGYHNHAWEIANKVEGQSALEYFEGLLEEKMILEVDAYWVHAGGLHVPDLLARLGKRVQYLHIKDGKKVRSSENTFNERGELEKSKTDTREQVPAGKGEVPIAEVLATAPHAQPIVEFDEYQGDIFEGIETSFHYVKGLLQ